MHTLLSVLNAATPAPSPENTLRPGLDPSQVSPGLIGFVMTFLLTAAVVLLAIDFNRRNRRLRYRAQYAERRAAEEHVGGYRHAAGAEPGDGRDGGAEASSSVGARPTSARTGRDDAAAASETDGAAGGPAAR
ncbi:hypothetical protein KVA01_04940 [Kocuria varians]|uniref:Uncharacterized protein n=1 Tax=Kocuria varians TaxID=1272 RepID=A0A4Y4D307_KOCVA|nr:hypothetical protein [Kocuria varians]GEC98339.1 hypothetical protein KVA01_04940 [Kocuria varians]